MTSSEWLLPLCELTLLELRGRGVKGGLEEEGVKGGLEEEEEDKGVKGGLEEEEEGVWRGDICDQCLQIIWSHIIRPFTTL